MIMLRDSVIQDIIQFLEHCERNLCLLSMHTCLLPLQNETQAALCRRHKVSRYLLKAQELYFVFLG